MKNILMIISLVIISVSAQAGKKNNSQKATQPTSTMAEQSSTPTTSPVEVKPILDLKSPVGKWKSIDDETKQPKSIIVISEKNGKLFGTIEKLFRKPDEDQNPKCDKCSGDKKDKLIIGMEIMANLNKTSDTEWKDGEILDPKNGKTYSCKIELIEDGKKLKVRGFLGVSLLGRTQVWEREMN